MEGAREVQGGEGSGEEGERKGRASELSESQLWVSGTLGKKNPLLKDFMNQDTPGLWNSSGHSVWGVSSPIVDYPV